MVDVVKFTWRNAHGYWIPTAWTTALSEDDVAQVRSRAMNGRPGLTDLKLLSRETIPEELRLTGRSRSLLSYVVLYDKQADSYDAQQMIDAMTAWTA